MLNKHNTLFLTRFKHERVTIYVQIIITMLKEVNTKSRIDQYYFFRISHGTFH